MIIVLWRKVWTTMLYTCVMFYPLWNPKHGPTPNRKPESRREATAQGFWCRLIQSQMSWRTGNKKCLRLVISCLVVSVCGGKGRFYCLKCTDYLLLFIWNILYYWIDVVNSFNVNYFNIYHAVLISDCSMGFFLCKT